MRRLEGPELIAYDVLEPLLLKKVRIVRVPFLAPGSTGMTIGTTVLLCRDDDHSGRRSLIAHELVHVGQYAELGLFGFLIRYGRDYLRGLARHHRHREAYLAIPAEIDARHQARSWAERHA